MNYILGRDRLQASVECFEDYVETDSEVRVIDKIIERESSRGRERLIIKTDNKKDDESSLIELFRKEIAYVVTLIGYNTRAIISSPDATKQASLL